MGLIVNIPNDCASTTVAQASFDLSCIPKSFTYPVGIICMLPSATWTSYLPTFEEVSDMILRNEAFVMYFSNGQKTSTSTQKTGADTLFGTTTTTGQTVTLAGTIQHISNSHAEMIVKNNNRTFKVMLIDDSGATWGVYDNVGIYIPEANSNYADGTTYPFTTTFSVPLKEMFYFGTADSRFKTIDNMNNVGVVNYVGVTPPITKESWLNVTGRNKAADGSFDLTKKIYLDCSATSIMAYRSLEDLDSESNEIMTIQTTGVITTYVVEGNQLGSQLTFTTASRPLVFLVGRSEVVYTSIPG